MLRLSCKRLPGVGILTVVGIAIYMKGTASMRVRLSPQEAGEAEQDAQDHDSCFKSGKCIRLMLPANRAPTHESFLLESVVTVPIYMCAMAGKPENERFLYGSAYAEAGQSLSFKKKMNVQDALWVTSFEEQEYYLKHIFVTSSADQIDGAHIVKDSHRPPLSDEEMAQRSELNDNSKFLFWTKTSSSQKIGEMSGDQLANSLTRKQTHDSQVRFVVDLKIETWLYPLRKNDPNALLKCPALVLAAQ